MRRRPSLLQVLGPGILVAATGVGAGDLLTAGLAGSRHGLTLLWAAWVGAILKWFLNEGIARWQLATGTPEEIAKLTSAFAIHVERGGVLVDHTLATAVIGRDGRIVEIWRGNGWSASELLDKLR